MIDIRQTTLLILFICFMNFLVSGQNYNDISNNPLTKKIISKQKFTVSGYISDSKTGERLIYAHIFDTVNQQGAVSNGYGFYSLSLPEGKISMRYSYIGYKPDTRSFYCSKDTFLIINLEPGNQIEEILVNSNQDKIRNSQMGIYNLTPKSIQALPGFLSESDVIKSIQLSPGVKGKEFSNFYVRGGGNDQNLILLDEATIYKYSHLSGLYSVFNTDALSSVKLYKGIIPSMYGGRLSSVLELHMREGNNQHYTVSGALGLLFSHLTVEGPILKNKMSFICSVRRSYFDVFFPLANSSSARNNKVFFLDLNAKVNYNISAKDKLFVSFFNSNDQFSMSNGSDDDRNGLFYHSQTFSMRYNHVFNAKLFSNLSLLYTGFEYGNSSKETDLNGLISTSQWNGHLKDYSLKNDYTFYFSPSNTIRFGGLVTLHRVQVGSWFSSSGGDEARAPLPIINALSTALYIDNSQELNPEISMEYGFRFSIYNNIGKSFYYTYAQNDFGGMFLLDTITYKPGEIYNTNFFPEPRISISYQLSPNSSVKIGYNRNSQNIHQISNTLFSTPFDIWYPTTPKVKPQFSDMVSAGYFFGSARKQYTASVEVYYKKMSQVVDIKDHASILGNPFFEDQLSYGKARSYGLEMEIRKNEGRFTGWMAYTYSRSFMKVPGINQGKEYPASYDVPHDFSVGLTYQAGKRFSFSTTWVYSSGAATMLPAGYYKFMDLDVPYYTGKNAGRLPDYHRLDLSMNVVTKKTIKRKVQGKKYHASWNFSIINLYNRKNPYYITLKPNRDKPGISNISKVYLLGFFPSISYQFNF